MRDKIKSELERLQAEVRDASAELSAAAQEYDKRRAAAQIKLTQASGQLTVLISMLSEKRAGSKIIHTLKTERDIPEPVGHPPPVPIMDGEDYGKLATDLVRADAARLVEKAKNDLLATRLAVRQIADRMSNGGHPGYYFETWCSQLRDIAEGKI